MSPNHLVPAKPAEITLDTLPNLFAHNRALYGGFKMTSTPPEPEPPAPLDRPEGVSEEEWAALGDPGKVALSREREARAEAERKLAAAHARPTPPKPPAPTPPAPVEPPAADLPQDAIAKAIADALAPVVTAVQAITDRDAAREADSAASKVVDAVMTAAKLPVGDREFHDPTDALSGIDLTKVIDANGAADPTKIKAELEGLMTAKPHLGKVVDTRRTTDQPGIGPGGSNTPEGDRVAASLARMQASTGARPIAQ